MQSVSGWSVGQEEEEEEVVEVVEMVEETVNKSRRQEELISFIFFDFKQESNHSQEWIDCKLLSRCCYQDSE